MEEIRAQLKGRDKVVFLDGSERPLNDETIRLLLSRRPNLAPRCLGLAPSFGFGDRLGLATAGHLFSLSAAGGAIQPVLAQQSIREMTRTGRSPAQVMNDALFGCLQAGYQGPLGADADHLKTRDDVQITAAAGFVFFTIDPSDYVDPQADRCPGDELEAKFQKTHEGPVWLKKYLGKRISLPSGRSVECSEEACKRAAVKYGPAVTYAVSLAKHIAAVMEKLGREWEIELSVDETSEPTSLPEHYMVAAEYLEQGGRLISLAPRFLGDFEKGVDYKGDLADFRASLRDHAAIAQLLGPYKLSLHSGSDKLSVYTEFARATSGMFHVKTAGTSYLEALRAAARSDTALFRRIISFARERYDQDKASYHVSADLRKVPPPEAVSDPSKLEETYLGLWSKVQAGRGLSEPGRQILHTTYGSVLKHETLGPKLMELLAAEQELYSELLAEHFERHLKALSA